MIDVAVVAAGQIHQSQHLIQSGGNACQTATGGRDCCGAHAVQTLHLVTGEEADYAAEVGMSPAGTGHEVFDNFPDRRGLVEMLLHELLHRKLAFLAGIAVHFGEPDLLAADEGVGRRPGVEMELIPKTQQVLQGPPQGPIVLAAQQSHAVEALRVRFAVTCKADPAQQLQIAQPAGRALQIGLEQVHGIARFAVFRTFLAARFLDQTHQGR